MFSAYFKTIDSLVFLFSSELFKQINCSFLTNICLRKNYGLIRNVVFWEISMKSVLQHLSCTLRVLSVTEASGSLREKPSRVRTELRWGPRVILSRFTQPPLLPYLTVTRLQDDCQDVRVSLSSPPELTDDLTREALTQPIAYTRWGPEAAGILTADFFVWQLPKVAWGSRNAGPSP